MKFNPDSFRVRSAVMDGTMVPTTGERIWRIRLEREGEPNGEPVWISNLNDVRKAVTAGYAAQEFVAVDTEFEEE